jgi:hypothetical protein
MINADLKKGPLRRPRPKWENIKTHLKEIECDSTDWILLAGSCEHGNKLLGSIK